MVLVLLSSHLHQLATRTTSMPYRGWDALLRIGSMARAHCLYEHPAKSSIWIPVLIHLSLHRSPCFSLHEASKAKHSEALTPPPPRTTRRMMASRQPKNDDDDAESVRTTTTAPETTATETPLKQPQQKQCRRNRIVAVLVAVPVAVSVVVAAVIFLFVMGTGGSGSSNGVDTQAQQGRVPSSSSPSSEGVPAATSS
jgi:hypothetical protein